MNSLRRRLQWFVLVGCVVALAGCSKRDPGPLEGTWRMANGLPMTITFREGEAEALGVIDEVTYERDGDSITVTWQTGISAGSSLRYRVVDRDTLESSLGPMKRVAD